MYLLRGRKMIARVISGELFPCCAVHVLAPYGAGAGRDEERP